MQITALISTIFTAVFLLIILSYYFLLLLPRKIRKSNEKFKTLTVIIPAHNEERYIEKSVQSVLDAHFSGKKHIIVVDDGSKDKTAKILLKFGSKITVIRTEHLGKSKAINRALAMTKSDLVAIVDGDSEIHPDSLEECIKLFYSKKVAAVCAVIKVKNRNSIMRFWMHIEQLYSSLTRSLYAKVNVNIVAAGPLAIFRRNVLEEMGGFSSEGFAEDADIAIRMIRAGYVVEYAEKAVTETNMPTGAKWFYRQRSRFARGTVNIIKRHVRLDRTLIRIYTLPLMVFGYFQAVIMAVITFYNIFSGYTLYYASKGVYFSFDVLRYFVEWLSVIGLIRWASNIFAGNIPLTWVEVVGLSASLLSYPLYLLAIVRYDKTVNWKHILAVAFLFPFWIIIMSVYFFNIGEWLRRHQYNRWTK